MGTNNDKEKLEKTSNSLGFVTDECDFPGVLVHYSIKYALCALLILSFCSEMSIY